MTKVIFSILSFFFFTSIALAAPDFLVVEGQLLGSGGLVPVESNNVAFTLQVYSPGAEQCLLYEETHNLNMTNSDGLFSLNLGEGSQSGSDYHDTNTLAIALNNSTGTVTPTTCVSGPSYTPVASDSRRLRISYNANDGSGLQTLTQMIDIGSSAFAMSAGSIDGLTSTDLLKINTTGSYVLTQANLDTVFDNVNYTELMALIGGTSTQYMSGTPTAAINANGQRLVSVAAPTAATDATNKSYVDTNIGGMAADNNAITSLAIGDAGKVLSWNGTQWTSASVGAGDFLASGSIAMTGDFDGGGNNLINVGNATIAGDINIGNNAVLTGDLTLSGGIGVTNGINSGASISIANGNALNLANNGDTWNVSFIASPSATQDTNYVLPVDDGNNGQVLTSDGAGALSWTNVGLSGNAVDSSHIMDNSIVDADISSGAAINVAKIGSGIIDNTEFSYLNGVSGDIQPQLDSKLNTGGDVMTGALTMDAENEVQFMDTTNSRYVGFKAPAAVTAAASFVWELPNDDGGNGQSLMTNGVGVLYWGDPVVTVAGASLNSSNIWVGNGSNTAVAVSLSGDATMDNTGALTIGMNAIDTFKIADGAVNTVNLADNSVVATKMALDSVGSSNIIDASIVSADIAANAVTTGNLADDSVTTVKIMDNAVTPAKILAGGSSGDILTNVSGVATWQPLAGSGITSFNGDTSGVQFLATDANGLSPAWTTSSGVHTLSIPPASGTGVTSGTISKTDYDNFNGKLGNALTSGQIFVGNASNFAGSVTLSGDASLSNTGVLDIASNAVSSLEILDNSINEVDLNIINSPASLDVLSWNGSDFQWVPDLGGNVSEGGNSFGYDMILGTNDNQSLIFQTSGSQRMAIDAANGRVGIGITSPATELDVVGGIKATKSVQVSYLSGGSAESCGGTGDVGKIRWNPSNKTYQGCYQDTGDSSFSWVNLSKQCPGSWEWVGIRGSAGAMCVSPDMGTSTYIAAITACTGITSPSGEVASLCSAQQLQKRVGFNTILGNITMVSDIVFNTTMRPLLVDTSAIPTATPGTDLSTTAYNYRCCL